MKFHGINEVLFEEAYEQLLSRYEDGSEDFMQPCAKKRSSTANQPKKPGGTKSGAAKPKKPAAPKKPSAPKKPAAPKKPNACAPKAKKSNDTTFSEEFDFMLCQRGDGSYYGTSGTCRKGTETTRDETLAKIEKSASGLSPETKAKLAKLNDEDLGRVATAVEKQGLTPEQGQQVARGVEKLRGEAAGGKKEGGANLQDPEQAAAYSKFYAEKKDLEYKAPYNTDPAVVKATLTRLKEEDPEGYSKTMSALGGKGSPTKEQLEAAGWKGRQERGEAVLKSLMDNDFKDVMGQDLSWRQGLQLDHRQAGSTGGTDRPSNWIWISSATNQAKGGMEAAAKKRSGSAADKEDYIRRGLIDKLNKNAAMSKAEVTAAKKAGGAVAAAKAQQAAALRDNLPLMTPSQRSQRINDASGAEMKSILKASVGTGKNPETGRATSYRPVLSGGGGARVRKDYGTVPQMKSIARMRWNEKLSEADLRNIGGALKASTGSTKSRSDLLKEMLGNFPRSSGLTAAERIAILKAAE